MTDLPPVHQSLAAGWQFRARTPGAEPQADFQSQGGWHPATVPGTVQMDLLRHEAIPDPYYGLNEPEVQWVSDQEWMYRLTFVPDEELLRHERVELHFAGLDTLCTVWLNGQELLRSDNMFVAHTADVKDRLLPGENTLQLLFAPVLAAGHALEAEHGRRPAWNGDPSRVYLRKAQYHYGWDWGPVLLTAGPWGPVNLRGSSLAITEVQVTGEVSPDLGTAFLPVRVTLTRGDGQATVRAELIGPGGERIGHQDAPAQPQTELQFELPAPQLWYPNGQGGQPLYTVVVRLERGGQVIDERRTRTGLRRLRVLQEPVTGEAGRSFTFEINNVPVFIGGANWIPEDLLLGRVTDGQYRERLTQARDGHLNMIRVWGGGIYEPDVFYDLCDELGLLVWQDFMFACGLYPAHPAFLDSVRQEAEQQVRRLRHHPALAIWAGNNEDYAVAESVGASGPGIDPGRFEARAIYEGVLPEVVATLDPGRLYWPGSPWGGHTSADSTVGDRHSWEVWHGPMARYQDYHRYQARFVSEFGMQSAPALSTLQASIPTAELYPESRTLVHHNKAVGPDNLPDGHRRLAVYLADNLRTYRDLAEYVYQTQFIQAEAMRYAYRDFRRRFEGPGRYAVSGALVWQLNDCWPGSSWAIIDSQGIAKPAYYTIRREMAPLTVGLERRETGAAVWLCSAGPAPVSAGLRLWAYTLDGRLVAEDHRELRVLPGRVTPLPDWTPEGAVEAGPLVYYGALTVDGEVVSRSSDFPEPYKYHRFGNTGLRAEQLSATSVRLSAERPTKGVWLDAGVRLNWDDNFIDLRPGEPRTVSFSRAEGPPLSVRALDTEAMTVTTLYQTASRPG